MSTRIPQRVEVRVTADGAQLIVPDLPADLEGPLAKRVGEADTRACVVASNATAPENADEKLIEAK